MKEAKDFFNDEVWQKNNGMEELKMTDNNISFHLCNTSVILEEACARILLIDTLGLSENVY